MVLEELVDLTSEMRSDLQDQGLTWQEADELVRPLWQLPDEASEPVETADAFLSRATTMTTALPTRGASARDAKTTSPPSKVSRT